MNDRPRHVAMHLLGWEDVRGAVYSNERAGFRVERGWTLVSATVWGPDMTAVIVNAKDEVVFRVSSGTNQTFVYNGSGEIVVDDDDSYVHTEPVVRRTQRLNAFFVFRDELRQEHVRHA